MYIYIYMYLYIYIYVYTITPPLRGGDLTPHPAAVLSALPGVPRGVVQTLFAWYL